MSGLAGAGLRRACADRLGEAGVSAAFQSVTHELHVVDLEPLAELRREVLVDVRLVRLGDDHLADPNMRRLDVL